MELVKDITEDKEEVDEEDMALWVQAGNLNKFECHFLDDESGTTRTGYLMEEGIGVFRGWAEETRRKYGHLIPEHLKPDLLKTFESVFLDVMGSIEWLENVLNKGHHVFKWWPEEAVRRKYGHLIKLMPRLLEGVVESGNEDEQFAPNQLTDSAVEEEEEGTNIPTIHQKRTDGAATSSVQSPPFSRGKEVQGRRKSRQHTTPSKVRL